MKNTILLLSALVLSSAAMAAPMTSVISVTAPLGGSGSGTGSGTWDCVSSGLGDGTVTMTETQTTQISNFVGLLSDVTTTQDIIITKIGGVVSGTAEVTSCTNNGGLYNGCDEISLNTPTAYDSITANSFDICAATVIDTAITVDTSFGDVDTMVEYTKQ